MQSVSSSASGCARTFLSCVCTLTKVRRIGLVMKVARTSMIHATTPHFLWSFVVQYAAHQLNLWPHVSLPETSPTLRWTGKVGDGSLFRVWGSRAFVCDMSVDKLSTRAILCVFLGFPPDAPDWQFYHPTSRRGLAPSGVSQVDPLPGIVPVEVAISSGAARGAASRGAEPGGAESEGAESGGAEPRGTDSSGGPAGASPRLSPRPEPLSPQQLCKWFAQRSRLWNPLPGIVPVEVAISSGAARGAASRGAEPGGAESEGAESGGAEPRGTDSSGGPAGASPRLSPRPEPLSPQQLCKWFAQRSRLWSGAAGAGVSAAGDTGAGGVGVTARAGGTRGAAAAGPGGARTRGTGAAETGSVGGAGAGGAGAGDPAEPGGVGAGGTSAGGAGDGGARAGDTGAVSGGTGAGSTVWPQPFFVPLLQQFLGLPSSTGLTPSLLCPTLDLSQALVPRPRPPPVPGTHAMALRPSSAPLRVPLPPPPESSLPAVPGPESDLAHPASPIVSRLLATVVTDPSFESTAASALVAELLDFAAACHLEYANALVAESESASPPSVGGECALGMDVLEDRQEYFECLAAAVPRFASMLLALEGDPDAPDIPTPRYYAEAITIPPSRANIVDGMWIFRAKRPPGSPPTFKTRYAARGFSQRQGVDYFQNFSPTLKMTTLRVLLQVAAQRDYELHSLNFSTDFLQGSLHEEIWLRRPLGFTGSFPAGTQWSLRQPVYGLRQEPREWHDTLRTTLAALRFSPSSADPALFLRSDALLLPFYVLVCVDDLVFATADTEALTLVKSELHKRYTWSDVGPSALRLLVLLATAHSSVYQPLALSSTFGRVLRRAWGSCLEGGVQLSSLVTQTLLGLCARLRFLAPVCKAGIYIGAMAAQELRWLTYLLTDLGEQPRSPPVLYVDNKAMIALCEEHRLEHRTKHIALRYFLARELQQRGQLRLAYVATRANTADIFTKALPPGDNQRFSTVLGLVPTLPHLLTA
ncbi:unnamed protein product [Closterium sp. NIES-53]